MSYVPPSKEELSKMSGAQVLAEVHKAELDPKSFASKEAAIEAILALAEPEWAREEKIKWAEESVGFTANVLAFVTRLNKFFNDNQLIWEALQSLVNTKYTTPDEVRKIVEEEVGKVEARMLENLVAQMKAALTPESADDQNVLSGLQDQLTKLTNRAKKAGWKF